MSYTTYPEQFANLVLTLCYKEGYLLDRFLSATKERFIREGGFKENLFKARLEFRNKSR
jgi:four helix bundle suffix protein